jgi:hypothetical protein
LNIYRDANLTESESNNLVSKSPVYMSRRLLLWLIAFGVCAGLCGGCVILAYKMRAYSREESCNQNLRWIGYALGNYKTSHRCYPPAQTSDKSGRAMQSWRACLMPYLGYYDFVEQYDMSEPWDSPKNRRWADGHISVFKCPDESPEIMNITNFVAVVGPETMWPGTQCTRPEEVVNEDAIFIVEYPDSDIPWSKPRDLTIEQFLTMIEARWARHDYGPHPSGLLYLTVHGEVRALGRSTDLETVRQLLRARNEQLNEATKITK